VAADAVLAPVKPGVDELEALGCRLEDTISRPGRQRRSTNEYLERQACYQTLPDGVDQHPQVRAP
jgi:hypothetical protein